MKKIICALLFLSVLSPLGAVEIDERMYVDTKDLDMSQGQIHFHTGHNIWLEAMSLLSDERGLYILESSLTRKLGSWPAEHKKQWQCPYCHNFWPMKTPCQNKDCPSTFP
jgi:hypothetical protein